MNMKKMRIKTWCLVAAAIVSLCVMAFALDGQEQPNPNRPVVLPNSDQPAPLEGTNQPSQPSTNVTLPGVHRSGITNSHDIIGTNAVNHGYANPSLTNRPNPNLQMP
jgi:hypothetical protein